MKKAGIATAMIIALVALAVCLIPLKTVAYNVIVDYQDTETYYVDEPYEAEVAEPLDYKVVNSYTAEETLTHETSISIGGIGESSNTWEEIIPVACVVVENTDTASGVFTISFSVTEPLDAFFLAIPLDLAPGETKTAKCLAYELGDWEYRVIPSTKTVTKTEYRQVQKQRTVTKQRVETQYKKVTLLDYFLGE